MQIKERQTFKVVLWSEIEAKDYFKGFNFSPLKLEFIVVINFGNISQESRKR